MNRKENGPWMLESIFDPLSKVGDNVVFYDVASRKILFFYRDEAGYRLKQIRGKRRLPITVRHSDILVKRMPDGTILSGAKNIPELVPQKA